MGVGHRIWTRGWGKRMGQWSGIRLWDRSAHFPRFFPYFFPPFCSECVVPVVRMHHQRADERCAAVFNGWKGKDAV